MRLSRPIVLALVASVCRGGVMNLSLVREGFEREETPYHRLGPDRSTMSARAACLKAQHKERSVPDFVLDMRQTAPRADRLIRQ